MADNDNQTQNASADQPAPTPAAPASAAPAPAPAKAAAVKTVKGMFRAKEDCYLGDAGYKAKDEVFYYEGVPHHCLVPAKASALNED